MKFMWLSCRQASLCMCVCACKCINQAILIQVSQDTCFLVLRIIDLQQAIICLPHSVSSNEPAILFKPSLEPQKIHA